MSAGGRKRTASAAGCAPPGAEKYWPDVGRKDAGGLASISNSPGGARWPRAARLVRSSEFRAVYGLGQRLASPHFVAFVLPNGRAVSRFGLSIKASPKRWGGSVLRNRLKRRVREMLRRRRGEIPAGWDIVLHPKITVAAADFAALEAEILQMLARGLAGPSAVQGQPPRIETREGA